MHPITVKRIDVISDIRFEGERNSLNSGALDIAGSFPEDNVQVISIIVIRLVKGINVMNEIAVNFLKFEAGLELVRTRVIAEKIKHIAVISFIGIQWESMLLKKVISRAHPNRSSTAISITTESEIQTVSWFFGCNPIEYQP
jgi:hypothetical protein